MQQYENERARELGFIYIPPAPNIDDDDDAA